MILSPHIAGPSLGNLVARGVCDYRLLSLFTGGRELIAVLSRADADLVARALQSDEAMASIPGCVTEYTIPAATLERV